MFKHFIGHISSKFSLVQTSNNFRHRTNCIAHKPMKFGICLSNSTFGYIQCDTVGSTPNLRSKVKQFISWEQASKLMKGKTVLMIAHRLTTVQDADKILVVDKGEIAEQGTHQELITQKGIYNTMWNEYQKAIAWTF